MPYLCSGKRLEAAALQARKALRALVRLGAEAAAAVLCTSKHVAASVGTHQLGTWMRQQLRPQVWDRPRRRPRQVGTTSQESHLALLARGGAGAVGVVPQPQPPVAVRRQQRVPCCVQHLHAGPTLHPHQVGVTCSQLCWCSQADGRIVIHKRFKVQCDSEPKSHDSSERRPPPGGESTRWPPNWTPFPAQPR